MGAGIASMVAARLGLGPWEVLHQGLSDRTGVPIGAVSIIVGVVALVSWLPLRQRLGIGTVLNTVLVGATTDTVLALAPDVDATWMRSMAMIVGILLCAGGSGLYIGAGLGPGPRDGFMMGLAARGPSVRVVRTAMEVTVLGAGWAMGGTVGVGTVLFALAIGPLVQSSLARFRLPPLAVAAPVPEDPHLPH